MEQPLCGSFSTPDASHGIDHSMMATTTSIAAVVSVSPRILFGIGIAQKSVEAESGSQCPLLAQSGHGLVRCKCPLLGVKRTWLFAAQMSAFTQSGHRLLLPM
ncbi:MAG: hypothetical protein WCE32_26325 [Pseudolabrys sp.]